MIMDESYSPAQRRYVSARKRVGKVNVDPVLFEFLGYGIVWCELDRIGENDVKVLQVLLEECEEDEVTEVHLGCELSTKRDRLRGRIRRHAESSRKLIAHPKINLSLAKGLRSSLTKQSGSYLTRLELNGVHLEEQSCIYLGRGVSVSNSLRFFSIANSRLGDAAFKQLSTGIARNKSIQDLVLRACGLTDASGSLLSRIISSHSQRRNDIRWSRSLRRVGGPLGPPCDLSPRELDLISLEGLLVVDLSENLLGNEAADQLCKCLLADDWVGAINLRENCLSSPGVTSFLQLLNQSNDTLVILDIRENAQDEATLHKTTTLDSVLRKRSELPGTGLLKRYLPKHQADNLLPVFGKQEQTNLQQVGIDEEKEDEGPFSSCVISSALLRWQSGHQLSKTVSGIVASLATLNSTYVNVEMNTVRDQDALLSQHGDDGETIEMLNSSRFSRQHRGGDSKTEISDEWEESAILTSTVDRETEHTSAELDVGAIDPLMTNLLVQVSELQDTVESQISSEKKVKKKSKKKDNQPRARTPTVRKPKPPKAQKVQTAQVEEKLTKAKTNKKRKSKTKKSSTSTKLAAVFREEINKALVELQSEGLKLDATPQRASKQHPTRMDSGERSKSLKVLEDSFQQLNRVLEQISTSSPHSKQRQSHSDLFEREGETQQENSNQVDSQASSSQELVEVITEKVAQRLATMWNLGGGRGK